MLHLALASKFLAVLNDATPLCETGFLWWHYVKNIIFLGICMVVIYISAERLSMSVNMLPLSWFVYMKLI